MKFGTTFLVFWTLAGAPLAGFEAEIRPIFERSCLKCHGGEKTKGGVDFSEIRTDADADRHDDLWETVVEVIVAGEMPPEDEPALSEDDRNVLMAWHRDRSREAVEAKPAVFRPRRLSGPEYRNTLRSLFGFDLAVAVARAEQTVAGEQSLVLKLLPTDPPGESGFINDTHRAPFPPELLETYVQLGEMALEKLFSESGRSQLRKLLGEALPPAWEAEDLTPEQAERLLRAFVPRALRRPVPHARLVKMLTGLEGRQGDDLLDSLKFELRALLISPGFLYRGLLMQGEPGQQQAVDSFELSERLSYFLWEDRPDEELTRLAADGSLQREEVLRAQVVRLLASPKARTLAESFGVQWLGLTNLDDLVGKDPIRHHALRNQITDFLHYLFTEERPVMELIDSRITFVNEGTAGFYGQDRQRMKRYHKPKGIERQRTPHQRLELVHAGDRGGLLTMPGILTMNQGPIQRGTWMLRRILGVPVGDPPADTPPFERPPPGRKLTFRERFEKHRDHASCARCHEKIDPLGFALEAYDQNGRFLPSRKPGSASGGPTIETAGQLPDGETFADFADLKKILLTRKREAIVRNAVRQTMAYALCRKLTRSDQPVVEAITRDLSENEGTWLSLFQQVVTSLPFRETVIPPIPAQHE